MALQTLESGGLWVPWPHWAGGFTRNTGGTYRIDADGEFAALIFRCPRTGTLDRFDADIGTVTNSPDNGLRFSFQSVDATTGLPTGTILGATNDALTTYAHTVTTGWKSTNFNETVSVTRGDVVAAVINIPSFTAGDDVGVTSLGSMFAEQGFPYGVRVTSTKETSSQPVIIPHYTDGYIMSPPHIGASNVATIPYNSGTTGADEWGLAFSLPFPAKIDRIHVSMAVAAGADFEVVLYDSDGTTVLGTSTHDGNITASASANTYIIELPSDVTLSANTTYRATIRPTTANNVTLGYVTFESADLMATWAGGDNFWMTSQLNQGGTWTNYNNGTDGYRRPRIALHLSAFDDGAGAGGSAFPVIGPGGLVL